MGCGGRRQGPGGRLVAIAGVGAFVTAEDKTSGTSIAGTTSAALEAGNVGILVVSCDNTATSDSTDGTSNEITSVTDTAGNTWSKISECREGSAGAAAGAVVAVFRSKITSELASGATITANFANSVAASAMTGYEFTVTAGNTLGVAGTTQFSAAEGVDPPSMAHSGLASKEYLFFRGMGIERDGPDVVGQFVPTTNYTGLTVSGTTGGGSATNSTAAGEFRIVTATGETSNPSTSPGTGDIASLFIAFEEVAASSATIGALGGPGGLAGAGGLAGSGGILV